MIHAVSKNGNLMLSVPLRPEGTLDDECRKILEEIGEWMEINGEAIYNTRPWKRFGEGETLRFSNPLFEVSLNWSHEDSHFTQKKDTVFAFQMKLPPKGRKSIITSFALEEGNPLGMISVKQVEFLGMQKKILFQQTKRGLELELSKEPDSDFPVVYAIKVDS